VNGSLRQPAANYRKQRYKTPPLQQRLAAGKADRFGCLVDQIDAGCNFIDYPAVLDVPWWLRAHQAIVVASLRD
jgi:hypothetical protein